MSLVYITFHTENILDLDNGRHYSSTRDKLKYTSKFRNMIKDEKQARHIIELSDTTKLITSAKKNNHQTMGLAKLPLQMPHNFLKKYKGIKWQRLNEHTCPPKKEIPAVPHYSGTVSKRLEENGKIAQVAQDELLRRHTKRPEHIGNFVAFNVELMKNLKPKVPPPRYVDSATGDRHNLLNSGLVPQYVCSKKFARVPCYLEARKIFLIKLKAKCENVHLKDKNINADSCTGVKEISIDERKDILKGLKTNFAELIRKYQGLSLHTDTVAKKLQKSKMENDLRQMEQDIYLIENNSEIYVSEY